MPDSMLRTKKSKKSKIKFLPKGIHCLAGSKDTDGSMLRKLAGSQVIYSGGSVMPPGKSKTLKKTRFRQRKQQESSEA